MITIGLTEHHPGSEGAAEGDGSNCPSGRRVISRSPVGQGCSQDTGSEACWPPPQARLHTRPSPGRAAGWRRRGRRPDRGQTAIVYGTMRHSCRRTTSFSHARHQSDCVTQRGGPGDLTATRRLQYAGQKDTHTEGRPPITSGSARDF
ncbi:hypothetical protein Bbelb_407400 [Branchiostoma belcheri]|nr:hypothetical protein Bbelb_407400 [Branchiostoma belcheri]